jgi:hypothetical protein
VTFVSEDEQWLIEKCLLRFRLAHSVFVYTLPLVASVPIETNNPRHVEWFEGNLADYEEDKKRRLGIDRVIPHRLKYKKSSR